MLIINAPHFYCGVILSNGICVRAAPIVKYMRGWSLEKCVNYAQSKGWYCI